VARHTKASPSSVRWWRAPFVQHADAGLDAKPYLGESHPKLPANQRQQLVELFRQGARAHGFRNELWTLARIAMVIARHLGVTYFPSRIWHVLRRVG
jgi:transposase